MDYIQLDDFKASDLTVEEGSKVNGYTSLTTTPKVVNQSYLKEQISTIDQIVADKYYDTWNVIVDEIGKNFVGMAKINSQFSGDARDRKSFLLSATRYMGMSAAELDAQKKQLESLNEGQSRQITLSGLSMDSTGYVYAAVNSMEMVISESVLPYVDEEMLGIASKVDQQDTTALKVINGDHIYGAFVVPKDTEIQGEKSMLKLKQKNIGTTGNEKNAAYYKLLVKRVDLLREYPEITIENEGKSYKVYLVDEVTSGENKIAIVMLKDYVNVFANDNIITTDINVQGYEAYTVPRSAITEKEGKTYLTTMERGYFAEPVEVTVARYDGGKAIMPVDDNAALSVGISYKVYP